jgi:hypothetical protein
MKRRGSTADASRVARERKEPNGEIGHCSEFEEGGHFAAMKAPALLVGDLQKFFRPLRRVYSPACGEGKFSEV